MLNEWVTGLQHIGIPTSDIEEMIAFFQSFGFRAGYRTENEGQAVCFLQLKNVQLEAYQSENAANAPGAIEHIALDVSDIERVYAHVSSMEYAIAENGIRYLPFWEKGVRFFTVIGPEQVKVEFSQKL